MPRRTKPSSRLLRKTARGTTSHGWLTGNRSSATPPKLNGFTQKPRKKLLPKKCVASHGCNCRKVCFNYGAVASLKRTITIPAQRRRTRATGLSKITWRSCSVPKAGMTRQWLSIPECSPKRRARSCSRPLANFYAAMGDQEQADIWFDKALDGFLRASRYGGVHYYHHLVDFYSDVRENGPEAVKWARKDLELRPNYGTEGALAWALYRDGQIAEANCMMDRALASGARDGHLFAKAATIKSAAGFEKENEKLARQAYNLNPNHDGFHVHRS